MVENFQELNFLGTIYGFKFEGSLILFVAVELLHPGKTLKQAREILRAKEFGKKSLKPMVE